MKTSNSTLATSNNIAKGLLLLVSLLAGSTLQAAQVDQHFAGRVVVSAGKSLSLGDSNNEDVSLDVRAAQIAELKAQAQQQLNGTDKKVNQHLVSKEQNTAYQTREQRLEAYKNGSLTQVRHGISGSAKNTVNHVNSAQANVVTQSYNGYRDFTIYEAYSRLFDDFDRDGFYQTFSVTFDADVYGYSVNEPADVYAEMYLSRNGGPWEHYYTTKVFTIYGDSPDDDFEVLTTLARGYKTDYYDVLIDLYEYGYSDVVATISGDDSDGLYALPLESSDRDEGYEVIHAGTLGGLSLGLIGFIALIRRIYYSK
ncbi:choice-of-anchor H family protein [Shewanella aestuarii]|uniref:choice-of-anchor H family protein n=1 Tax=Shewanella aestuarii TaxID=1028752 RepID=UPI001ABF56EE|nr:choice-of-anchor H family protein [Shewanella aestuarii]